MARTRRRRALVINLVLFAVLAVGGLAVYATFHRSSASAAATRTVPVQRGNVVSTVSASGTLDPADTVTLKFTTDGTVTAINVNVGDKVTAGQALASIDPTSADQKVRSAELDVTRAEQTVNKDNQTLANDKSDYGSKSDQYKAAQWQLTSDSAALEQAQISLAEAQTTRTQADLYAPIDGTVTAVDGVVGENSSAATDGFITIGTVDHLEAKASFAEVDAAKVKVGMDATVTFDALPGESVAAKVTAVSTTPTTTNDVNSYPVTVDLSQVPAGALMGMTANVSVTVDSRQNVLAVTPAAITTTGNVSTVTKLVNGKQEIVPVQLGLEGDSTTEIASGVSAGDQLVVAAATAGSGGGAGAFPAVGGLGGGGLGGPAIGGGGPPGG